MPSKAKPTSDDDGRAQHATDPRRGSLREQIEALSAVGLTKSEVAHRLNVAQSTVHYHLRRAADVSLTTPGRRRGRRPRSEGVTRDLVAELLIEGLTRAEIARRLDISKSTVTYHAAHLGEPVNRACAQRYDWGLIQRYYDEGHSVRECERLFGFSAWTWSQAVARGAVVPRPTFMPLAEVFAAGTRRNRGHLKQRLLRGGIKEERCELCGLVEWRGERLALALHHLNGDRHDNRIENLQLLCPNCHSQTDTFGGRNGANRSAGTAHRNDP